uniref:Uncharacterized protein C21orf63 n=1 Tax=Lygus hesperus TaxID=30085 RepID=A0A146LGI7_LYGHE
MRVQMKLSSYRSFHIPAMSGASLIIPVVVLLAGHFASGLRTKLVCEYETMNIDCWDDQTIAIKSVEFGRKNGLYCNTNNLWSSRVTNCTTLSESVATVTNKCQHRKSCSISGDPITLGDPCEDVQKYLEVGYECENGELKTQFVCELDTLIISCASGKKIVIYDATFGRMKPTMCLTPSQIVNTNLCRSANSTAILASRCDGKQSCTTLATSTLFGDPCQRIGKYLEVKYLCV